MAKSRTGAIITRKKGPYLGKAGGKFGDSGGREKK